MRIVFITLLIAGTFLSSPNAEVLDSISSDGLKSCISEYRNGFYSQVVDCINNILPNLTTFNDSLESYKMLALSFGMLNQIEKSKENFKLALEKDSTMVIDTLAFPPNIALIFNQVKLENRLSLIESNAGPRSEPQLLPLSNTSTHKAAWGPLPVVFLSSAILSAGGAGYLYYDGYNARRDYRKSRNQSNLDAAWNKFVYSIAGGVSCTAVFGAATFFFFKTKHSKSAISLYGWKNGVIVACNF